MSKKDKSKFKKQIKAQLLQEVAQAQSQIQTPQKPKIVSQENIVIANKIADNSQIDKPMDLSTDGLDLPQIRYDLKKTAIVILILAAVMVSLYYIDLKNGALQNFGNWLFKVLNIQ